MSVIDTKAPLQARGAAPAKASFGLVLVHGRGGSAHDIMGLGKALGLPDLTFVAPQAPGHSWWPTSFLAPMAQMEQPLKAGLAAVNEAVETLERQGLTRDRIGLVGFSQGACLALEYAARTGGTWAGVYGLSGGLVGTHDEGGPSDATYGFAGKGFEYRHGVEAPVRISVHARDPHIPLARAEASAEVFKKLGADVTLDVAPGGGHGILQGDIAALRTRFNQV